MTRLRLLALSLSAPLLLSACGIKGDLATPPPLWEGKASDASVPEDNTAAESIEDATDPFNDVDEAEIDDDIYGDDDTAPDYGVDVAD